MKRRSLLEDTRPAVVVLLSGGIDSTVALAQATRAGRRCYALVAHYGQPNGEDLCAMMQSGLWGAALLHADVTFRGLHGEGGALTQRGGEGVSPHYVPGRNAVLVSLALSTAETVGAEAVVIGVTAEDRAGFPDCRPAYFDRWRALAACGMAKAPAIETPLASLTKADVIRLGAHLGVDFTKTRSCYAATPAPCGMCGACVVRARGFHEAGIPDPTLEVSP